MRFAAFLILPLVLGAQTGSSSSDRLTEALVSEMQQLRLAIERSTLLSSRTQLAVSQLQLQEASVTRLTNRYDDVRSGGANVTVERDSLAEMVKRLESQISEPNKYPDAEGQLRQAKVRLEALKADAQERSAKESEIAIELRNAQNRVAESHARITDLEKALDTAIQQLVKTK